MRRTLVLAIGAIVALAPAVAAASWTPSPTPTQDHLRGTAFANDQLGLAVGTGETILRTTDGGASWTQQLGGFFGLGWYDATWASETTAFVAGANAIFQPMVGYSLDAGTTWDFQTFYIDSNEATLHGITTTPTHVLAAATLWNGDGAIVTNTVAGPPVDAPWTRVHATGHPLLAIDAELTTVAAVGAWGNAYVSQTAGVGFAPSVTPTESTLRGVDVVTTTTAYAVGDDGTVLKTTDAGATWTQQATPTETRLSGVAFSDEDIGVAVGDDGTVLSTTDGGQTWRLDETPTTEDLNAAAAGSLPGSFEAVAVGDGGTVITGTA